MLVTVPSKGTNCTDLGLTRTRTTALRTQFVNNHTENEPLSRLSLQTITPTTSFMVLLLSHVCSRQTRTSAGKIVGSIQGSTHVEAIISSAQFPTVVRCGGV